ncbi:MAG: diguanylate cyclase, partial [bacterium]
FERELQESELQYRSTIESMSQAIHVVDRGLKVIIANKVFKKWSEALGFSSDIVGKTIFEVFPFLSENVRDEYNQVFETGEILITEENNNIAGKGIITETRKIPIFEEGRVSRVVTVVDEITERKNWEYALRESEERYKRIVDTVTDYIFTVYLEAGKPIKTVYGPTCLAVTGYSPQELTADAYLWINMVHKDDRKAVGDYTGKILSGTENLSIEHRIIKKDGAMRWVRNTSILHFDEAGKLLSYDGIIQDVTESKTVESQISRINECFLSFGTDPLLNINMLVSLCGELLGADCAMYNRIEGGLLCTIGQWNTPPDFNPKDSPEGHICFDVIKKNEDEILVIRDLRDSPYAKTDPNVTKYGLDTYLGYPVRISGETIGSLCAVYQRDFTPNQEDKKIIGIIASAIGTEEERRKTGEILRQRIEFERIITTISANFIKIEFGDIEPEINKALETIGRFVGVDRSYIFLVNNDQSRTSNAYEWCAEGVEPLKEGLQNIPVDKFPWFYKKIKNLENIYIPRLEDFPKEAAVEKEFISSQGLKSIMIVPMVYGKEPVGFIGFDSVEEKKWSQENILLLRTVGEIFTNTLEHKKAEEKIGAGERFLSNIFNSIQDGISILDKELNIIRVNLTMEQWYEHYRPLAGKKCFQAYHGRKEPCKVCPSIRTLSNGEAAHEVVPKIGAGGEIVGWLDLFSFPLYDEASGKLKGAIEYVRDITDRKRTEKKLEILNKELVKSNQRLKQLSLKDSQTGLFNHRYLGEVMEAEFYRARRYAHPISVLMMDIDYFKSINDVYGHQFGDLALRQLAKYLKKMVRRYDIIIRFGGEEFIIIFPGTDRATALVLAQRLLDSMNTYRFGNKEHEVKLKLSVAVVSYPDDKIIKGMDMVELADQILSKVKESGGNKVYSSVDTKKEKALGSRKKVETGNVKFLQDKLEKLSKRANQSLIESVFAFAKTIEVKDHYTGEHVESTVHYAMEIANALGLPKYEIELIKQAAMLHDLGKIGISEKILLKSSKLNKEEFDEIKKHPQIGVDIIRPIQFFHNIIPLMLYHHERWDGKGYPRGLKGEEIPIGARIIAISDVYQALTSHRPYRKKAFSKEEALKIIKDGAGTQFDPKIVPVFLNIVQKEK